MVVIAPSLAKEIGDSTVNTDRTYTNGGSWENKCSYYKPKSINRVYTKV